VPPKRERRPVRGRPALRILNNSNAPAFNPATGYQQEATLERLADPRFRRDVERVHAHGPRAFCELLAEIARAHGITFDVARRLERYAALDPSLLRSVGGDQFPPSSPWLVEGDR
jgi:hypothetical protein